MQINTPDINILDIITNKIKQISIIAQPIIKRVFLPALSTIKPEVKGPLIKEIETINEKI